MFADLPAVLRLELTAAPIVWIPYSPSVLASTISRANSISSMSSGVSSRLGTFMT
jgi:hypothetical protein